MKKSELRKLVSEEIKKLTEADAIDTITMDVPLFIRMLEYAKEDAKTDMDLHDATARALNLSKQSDTLTMDNYDSIVGKPKTSIKESLWPLSKLADSFVFKLHDELKKQFPKYTFWGKGYDLYMDDHKILTINGDTSSINSIVDTIKKITRP